MSENTKRSASDLAKRYALFIVGLFISALGVAVTKRAELGVSPVSSVANILSLRFTFFTIGSWLIVWNCVLILGQIIILRRDFQWIQLLQVPLSFLFGRFTDFGMMLSAHIPTAHYAVRLGLVLAGTAILGFGIALTVTADVIMNSGEAFVKAIADKTHFAFGNVKIGFDVGCVTLSVILSLVLFAGAVEGTREGTVIAALLTGVAVKIFTKLVRKPIETHILAMRSDRTAQEKHPKK